MVASDLIDMKNSSGDENGDSHNKLELDSEVEKNEVAKRQQTTRKRSIKNSPSVLVDTSSNKSEPLLKKTGYAGVVIKHLVSQGICY